MVNLTRIKKDLQKLLSEERYLHSLLVASEAKNLANKYGLDANKAYLAGLVHDIAKYFSFEENKVWIQKYNLNSDLLLPENTKIIHAAVGAVYVGEIYKLDEETCDAIKYHTIGNERMNDFAKIIFIADKIGRENIDDELQEIKKTANENLDKAMLLCIKKIQTKLVAKGKKLHEDTLELLKKLQKHL